MAEKKPKNWVRALSDALNMGMTIACCIAVGYLGGKWLDGKFATAPWISIAGFMLGVAASIKVMWDRMKDK